MYILQPTLGQTRPLTRPNKRHGLAVDQGHVAAGEEEPQAGDAAFAADAVAQGFEEPHLPIAREHAGVDEEHGLLRGAQAGLDGGHGAAHEEEELVPVALAGGGVGLEDDIPRDFRLSGGVAEGFHHKGFHIHPFNGEAAAELFHGGEVVLGLHGEGEESALLQGALEALFHLAGVGHLGGHDFAGGDGDHAGGVALEIGALGDGGGRGQGAHVAAAPFVGLAMPVQLETRLGQQFIQLGPLGQGGGVGVAALYALADLVDGEHGGVAAARGEVEHATGKLEHAGGVHPPGIEFLAAGEGGPLGGGGGEAHEAGIAQGRVALGQAHGAEALQGAGGRGQGILLGQLVGPLAEANRVFGEFGGGGDEHAVIDTAHVVARGGEGALDLHGGAHDGQSMGAAGGLVEHGTPDGDDGVGQFAGEHDAPGLFEHLGDVGAQGGKRGVFGPAGLELGEQLADARAGEAHGDGHIGLAGPWIFLTGRHAEEVVKHETGVFLLAGAGLEDALGELIDAGGGRIADGRQVVFGQRAAGGGLRILGHDAAKALAQDAGGLGDFAAGGIAHAAHVLERAQVELEQISNEDHIEPIKGIGGACAEAEIVDRSVGGGAIQPLAQGRLLFGRGGGADLFDGLEALAPGVEHFVGVVEALIHIAPEGLAEEGRKAIAQAGIETLGLQGDLAGKVRGIALGVAPDGLGARGEFVERDRDGVALGVEIPALAQGQEGIKIAVGARADLLNRRAGQGEVEKHEVQLVPAAHHAHRDVVGLDVAVGDTLLFQIAHGADQIVAEALEQVDVEAALDAQAVAQGLDAQFFLVREDGAYEKARILAHVQRTHEIDHAGVAQLWDDLGFVHQTLVVVQVRGDLEHEVLAFALHEHGDGGAALTQALDHPEAAGEEIALLGVGGGVHFFHVGRAQLALGQIEVFQEVGDGVEAVGDVGVGAVLDEVLKFAACGIEDGGDLQPAGAPNLLAEREAVFGRELAGEEIVGQGAQGEDIEVLAQVPRGGEDFRGHEGGAGIVHEAINVRGEGAGTVGRRAAGGGVAHLPVEHANARVFAFAGDDENTARGEGAVNDLVFMGVLDDFRDLTQEVKALIRAEGGVMPREVVVQAQGRRIIGEEDGRAELVLGEVVDPENAGMLQGFEQLELAAGGPLDGAAILQGRLGADEVEANEALGGFQLGVGGHPVLIAGTLIDQGLEDIIADLAVALARADAGLLHGLGNEFGHGPVVLAPGGAAETLAATAILDGRHDAVARGLAALGRAITQAYTALGDALELTDQVGGGAKNECLDERELLFTAGSLAAQQAAKLLGFSIAGEEGIVEGGALAFVVEGPQPGVAAESAGVTLDLEEKEALRRKDEEVHLVDAAVFRDKLKV